jgi:opacity protein-like surface antigen
MNRIRVFAAALAAAAILPATAAAQSLPFRAGQWGAEFQSGDLTSAGVMRFMSPRTALVFDVGVLNLSTEQDDGTETVENSTSLLALRLGFRNYMPVANRVSSFWSIGGEVARGSNTEEVSGPFDGTVEEKQTSFGVFGQLGADFHVTPNIAVGIAYDLSIAKISGEVTQDPGGADIDLSGTRILGTFTPVRFSIFF